MPGSARPGASRPHAPTRGRVRRGLDGSGLTPLIIKSPVLSPWLCKAEPREGDNQGRTQALASRSTACCRRLTSSALRPRVLQPRTESSWRSSTTLFRVRARG